MCQLLLGALALTFRGTVGVVYDLQFVPAGEVCGSARLALSPVDLLAYDFSASTKVLHVDFMPLHVGAVQLCAGPHLVAHVKVR